MLSTITSVSRRRSVVLLRHDPLSSCRGSIPAIRHYAAPAKPDMKGSTSKQNSDMWKAYNASLRNFVFSGKKLDTKTNSFYTTAIGQLGIPGGKNIPAPITNAALFNVADTLLDPDNPVFTPGTGSYIDRQSRFLGAVQLKKNTNAGAWIRLQDAQSKQSDVQAKIDELRPKAKAAFDADTDKPDKMPFRTWVSNNYPQYDSLNNELQQAANATDSAMIDVYGPGSTDLRRKISYLNKAQDMTQLQQGLNMPTSDQVADVMNGGKPDENAVLTYKPLYTIDKSFSQQVDAWIRDSDAASGSAKKTTIDIDLAKSSSETWAQSGFSDNKASVGGGYWFITASIDVENTVKEEHLTTEELGSGLKARLSAASIKTFDVKSGSWDGDFAHLYSGKDISMLASFTLPPASAVSQLVMGYNVSLDITLDSRAAKQVKDLYERTTKVGGSISVFGCPIRLGGDAAHESSTSSMYSLKQNADDFSSISITGEDSGVPILLGVVGRKLPGVNH